MAARPRFFSRRRQLIPGREAASAWRASQEASEESSKSRISTGKEAFAAMAES